MLKPIVWWAVVKIGDREKLWSNAHAGWWSWAQRAGVRASGAQE